MVYLLTAEVGLYKYANNSEESERMKLRRKHVLLIAGIAIVSLLFGTVAIATDEDGGPFQELWQAIFGIQEDVEDLQDQIDLQAQIDSLNASLVEIESRVSAIEEQPGAILSVENVRFYDTNKTDITIRNSGTSNAKIVTVYMGTSSTNLQDKTVSPALPQNLVAGNSVTLTITHTGSWTVGTRYYFKVATEAGQTLPFNEKA